MENGYTFVECWLQSLGQQQYTKAFIDNGYDDLEICKQIGYSDLDAIGVKTSSHRIAIYNGVELLRRHGDSNKPLYYLLENPNSPSKSKLLSGVGSSGLLDPDRSVIAQDSLIDSPGYSHSTSTSNSSSSGVSTHLNTDHRYSNVDEHTTPVYRSSVHPGTVATARDTSPSSPCVGLTATGVIVTSAVEPQTRDVSTRRFQLKQASQSSESHSELVSG